jgi:hypothetical protein
VGALRFPNSTAELSSRRGTALLSSSGTRLASIHHPTKLRRGRGRQHALHTLLSVGYAVGGCSFAEEVIAADCDTGGDGALLSRITITRLGISRTQR